MANSARAYQAPANNNTNSSGDSAEQAEKDEAEVVAKLLVRDEDDFNKVCLVSPRCKIALSL